MVRISKHLSRPSQIMVKTKRTPLLVVLVLSAMLVLNWFRSASITESKFTLNSVGVYLRTYRGDAQLAASAVFGVLAFLPEAEISVVCPSDDVQIVTDQIIARLGQKDPRVRVLPVGMGKSWYADRAKDWTSREALLYDAFHVDLYVRRPLILYTESDVLLLRQVRLDDLISLESGLPYVDRIELGHLCRSLMRSNGRRGSEVCGIHATTAHDAGTLFGVFNEFDFERRIPFSNQRRMYTDLRQRIAAVHGQGEEDEDGTLQRVLNYFARHRGPNCGNGLRYVPISYYGKKVEELVTPEQMQEALGPEGRNNSTYTCRIGLSKPHTLGTYAHYFASHLHHPLDLLKDGRLRRNIALQLSSHKVRNPDTGELSQSLEAFIDRLYVQRDPDLVDLQAKDVNQEDLYYVNDNEN